MIIKVFEINTTQINANLREEDFSIKEINAKELVKFPNEGNEREWDRGPVFYRLRLC